MLFLSLSSFGKSALRVITFLGFHCSFDSSSGEVTSQLCVYMARSAKKLMAESNIYQPVFTVIKDQIADFEKMHYINLKIICRIRILWC